MFTRSCDIGMHQSFTKLLGGFKNKALGKLLFLSFVSFKNAGYIKNNNTIFIMYFSGLRVMNPEQCHDKRRKFRVRIARQGENRL